MQILNHEQLTDYHRCYLGEFTFGLISNDKKYFIKFCQIPAQRLDEFKRLNIHRGITYPLETYQCPKGDYLSAYMMNYYNGAKPLNELYTLPTINKKMIIFNFFTTLKTLSNHIVLGDIHSENLLVWHNKAIICDWESYKRIDEAGNIPSLYNLNEQNKSQNPLTDYIKMVINCLSLYLKEDLERLIRLHFITYEELFQLLMKLYPSLQPILDPLLDKAVVYAEIIDIKPSKIVESLPTLKKQYPSIYDIVLK